MISLAKKKEEITFDDILSKCNAYIENEEEIQVIKDAYMFAKEKHAGQYRKSG